MKKNESLFTIELMNCNAFLSHLILHAFENSIRRRSHLGKAESRERREGKLHHFVISFLMPNHLPLIRILPIAKSHSLMHWLDLKSIFSIEFLVKKRLFHFTLYWKLTMKVHKKYFSLLQAVFLKKKKCRLFSQNWWTTFLACLKEIRSISPYSLLK